MMHLSLAQRQDRSTFARLMPAFTASDTNFPRSLVFPARISCRACCRISSKSSLSSPTSPSFFIVSISRALIASIRSSNGLIPCAIAISRPVRQCRIACFNCQSSAATAAIRKASAARGGNPASRNSLELKYQIIMATLPVPRRRRGVMICHDMPKVYSARAGDDSIRA